MDFFVRIRNFKKYKGRTDVEHASWFRLSNRFLEDPEFFGFSSDEKLVWIEYMSISSYKNSDVIHISYEHMKRVCGFHSEVVDSATKKLIEIKCIDTNKTGKFRRRNVADTSTGATDRQTGQTKQNKQDSPDAKRADLTLVFDDQSAGNQ